MYPLTEHLKITAVDALRDVSTQLRRGLNGAGDATGGLGEQDALPQLDLSDGECTQFVLGLCKRIRVVVFNAVDNDASKTRDQAFDKARATTAHTA